MREIKTIRHCETCEYRRIIHDSRGEEIWLCEDVGGGTYFQDDGISCGCEVLDFEKDGE